MTGIFYFYSLLNEISEDTRVANASIAGFMGKSMALPFDVIRKRMQVKSDSSFYRKGYDNMFKAMKIIWAGEGNTSLKKMFNEGGLGVKGVFRGFMITCVKSSVSSAVTFYTYEHMKQYLNDK